MSDFTLNTGMRENLKYLLFTLLVAVSFVFINNFLLDESDTTTIGYCDVSLVCNGADVGFCFGIERQHIECVDPLAAIEQGVDYEKRAEVECALQAYKLCDEMGIERGTSWAPHATYDNQSCQELSESRNVELIDCFETFRPLHY